MRPEAVLLTGQNYQNAQPIPLFRKLSMNPWLPRIGIGHDTHRLKPGGPLRLGGIDIPHDRSLDGHSDADVLLHAIIDAILGAAALGDIGEMFPDTAAENAGRDSGELLQLAWREVQDAGFLIGNLDCIVFAQAPKLSTYKRPMAERIADLLEITPQQIGIKAKTGEGVGPVGESQIMQAQCVALLTIDSVPF
jgi:2-C-methyl-D-erythritol 2,4-cyclodiphosphate synthase